MSYNGWTNRETWLVALYFMDDFVEYVQEDFNPDEDMDGYAIGKEFEKYVLMVLDDELSSLSPFLSDLIDFGTINWTELGEHVLEQVKDALDNSW